MKIIQICTSVVKKDGEVSEYLYALTRDGDIYMANITDSIVAPNWLFVDPPIVPEDE